MIDLTFPYYAALIALAGLALLSGRALPYACLLLADWAVWLALKDDAVMLMITDAACALGLTAFAWWQWEKAHDFEDGKFPFWEAVASCAMWSALVVQVVFWTVFRCYNIVLGDFYVWGLRLGFLIAFAALVMGSRDELWRQFRSFLDGLDSRRHDRLPSGGLGRWDCPPQSAQAHAKEPLPGE